MLVSPALTEMSCHVCTRFESEIQYSTDTRPLMAVLGSSLAEIRLLPLKAYLVYEEKKEGYKLH